MRTLDRFQIMEIIMLGWYAIKWILNGICSCLATSKYTWTLWLLPDDRLKRQQIIHTDTIWINMTWTYASSFWKVRQPYCFLYSDFNIVYVIQSPIQIYTKQHAKINISGHPKTQLYSMCSLSVFTFSQAISYDQWTLHVSCVRSTSRSSTILSFQHHQLSQTVWDKEWDKASKMYKKQMWLEWNICVSYLSQETQSHYLCVTMDRIHWFEHFRSIQRTICERNGDDNDYFHLIRKVVWDAIQANVYHSGFSDRIEK